MNNKMNNNTNASTFIKKLSIPVLFLAAVVLLVSFLLLVSPSSSSFVVSFVPLVLVWLVVYAGIMSLRLFARSISASVFRTFAATSASVVTLLLMFSALGQVSLFDVSLLLALAMLGVFYFRRSWPN